jgi:hypothetical protein
LADELFLRLLGLTILAAVFEELLSVEAVVFFAIFGVRLTPSFRVCANLLSVCGVVSAPLFQDSFAVL